MLTLYHLGQAVCARKVRLALAEKGLDFESKLLARADLRSSEYLSLNPHGYVPTLVHNGTVIVESRTISEYIEETFPNPSLMPPSPLERASVRNWTKRIDDSLHLYIYILSFVAMPGGAALQAASLPLTPIKRQITLDLIAHGSGSVYFPIAIDGFKTLMADLEGRLAQSSWVSGDAYGLADADYTPYLRRLEEIGFWQLVSDDFSSVGQWFDRVKSRPSYIKAISDWETEADQEQEVENIRQARPVLQAALERS